MLSKYFWTCGLPLECVNLSRATSLRKLSLPPQQGTTANSSVARGRTSCPPPSLHAGIVSSLSVCRSHAFSQNHFEFLSAAALLCLEGLILPCLAKLGEDAPYPTLT